jgi:AcrR family transcriptional regulator
MNNGRVSIASIRKGEIVAAAAAVINEQGIQNLSLSEIEKKVGMSRGQLMYYFKTKEDILLAVFDRTMALMCQQHQENPAHPFADMDWLDVVRYLLNMVMEHPPANPEFHALQFTFLSQISHRADFRERLANLYEEWRSHGSDDLRKLLKARPPVHAIKPRALSTVVQAILHGLAIQKAADPDAVKTREAVELCLDMLSTYLWNSRQANSRTKRPSRTNKKRRGVHHDRNGKAR